MEEKFWRNTKIIFVNIYASKIREALLKLIYAKLKILNVGRKGISHIDLLENIVLN